MTARLAKINYLAYALPAAPLGAAYFPVFVFVAEYYAARFGIGLALIGAIFLFVRLFDAVTDPIIGWLSDRVPSRFGRRRVWLLIAAPVMMVSTWALFVPPEGAGAIWLTGWVVALTGGWTLAMTPYFAWGAEMSGDYAERATITLWRESLGLTGTIIAALLYGSTDQAEGMQRIAVFVIVLLPLTIAICFRFVDEPRDFSRTAPSWANLTYTMRDNRPFRRLILAYILNGAGNGIAATLFIFFVSYRLDAPSMGGPLLVVYFLAAVLAAPLWGWLAARFGKHRVWCWAMVYAGLVFVWTVTLGPGDWVWFAVICVLSGAALSADLSLPAAIQADVVDQATASSGAQQTGAFFALWSVATKFSVAVSGAAALVYLDAFGFDVSGDGTTGHAALSWLYGLGPIALKMMAVALMWTFPLDQNSVAETRQRIEAL